MERGFTLIEILIALGISAILVGSGFLISIDTYRSTLFDRELNLLIQLLEKARSQSLNNIDGESHGLKIENDRIVIFSGNSYDPARTTNEEIKRDRRITINGPDQIIFYNIDATSSTSYVFEISDGVRSKNLSVGKEGEINW